MPRILAQVLLSFGAIGLSQWCLFVIDRFNTCLEP